MEEDLVLRQLPDSPDSDHELTEYRLIEGERAQIYSTDGTLLREYSGFYEAEIPKEDWPVVGGQVLVHYHVNDTAFSKKDLVTAARFNLLEIRVISRSMVFSMKRRGKAWPDPRTLAARYDRLENDSRLTDAIEMIETSPEFLKNSWDPELDLLKIRTGYISRQLAKEFGLIFHARRLRRVAAAGRRYQPGISGP
ncbi:MAG TPA: hypothetical protein VLY83_04025 [Methanoregula sp.]|nr:hypothetical protein [Methanoregula sp.]